MLLRPKEASVVRRLSRSIRLLAVASVFAAGFALAPAQDITQTVAAGQLQEAIRLARQAATESEAGQEWQMLGNLLLLDGKPAEAERAYDRAMEIEVGAARESGLEPLAAPGQPLHRLLTRLKPAVSLGLGRPALFNNRGVAKLMLGRSREAMEDFDQAVLLVEGWGLPWLNGAIAAIDLAQWDVAHRNARFASELGERSARLFAVRAQIALAQENEESARDFLREAERIDPDFPYGLLVKARLLRHTGNARDAERALIQALTYGPIVASESSFQSSSGQGYGLGGGFGERHLRLFHQGMSPSLESYRFLVLSNRASVEGREAANQFRNLVEGVYSGSLGTFYVLHQESGGGRPGADRTIVGIAPQPQANYSLRSTTGIYLKRFAPSLDDDLLLLGKHRTGIMRTQLQGQERQTAIDDEENHIELRWDRRMGQNRLTMGGAWSVLSRGGTGARVFDPAEVIMGFARTEVWTLYGIYTWPISPLLAGSIGGIVGNTSTGQVVQPILELQFGGGPRPIRIGISPRLNDINSNLLPFAFVAEPPLRDRINRHEHIPQDFNSDPFLLGRDSRVLDYEFVVNSSEGPGYAAETLLFHRRMFNARLQSADPRMSTQLRVTPVSHGEATGLGQRVRFRVAENLSLRAGAFYQIPRGRPDNPTFLLEEWPNRVPTDENRLPNFPNVQGSVELDWSPRPWNFGISLNFVGDRIQAFTVAEEEGTATYVGRSPALMGIHLFVRRPITENGHIMLALYNLTGSNFYLGYPGRPSGVFGFEYRF
jgi:tetratricopeptide (TPR) repeat protein